MRLRLRRHLLTLATIVAFATLGAGTSSTDGDSSGGSSAIEEAERVLAEAEAARRAGGDPPLEDGTVNGVGAVVRRRTDSGWVSERFEHAEHGEMPRDVFSVGGDVYATGYAYTGVPGPDNGVVWRRTPEGWQEVFRLTLQELGDGWGSGPNDVWVAGVGVAHFDGTTWSPMMLPRIPGGSYRVSGSSAQNVWLFGSDGSILRRDASGEMVEQMRVVLSDGEWITDACVIDESNALAAGSDGHALRVVNGRAVLEPTGTDAQLAGAFASGPNDLYLAGTRLLHSSGDGRWAPVAIPAIGQVTDVRGTAANDVWALGLGGIVHFDGTAWTSIPMAEIRGGAQGAMSPTGVAVANGKTFVVFDLMNM